MKRPPMELLLIAISVLGSLGSLPAQDHTVPFSTTDPGTIRSIPTWGLDVTWPSPDNMRRGLIFMGASQVDVVRVPFLMNAALSNGELPAAQKADLTSSANIAKMAGASKAWSMSAGTGGGVDPWYKSGNDVIPVRWVQAMEAAVRHYGRTVQAVEPFNEPDYGWGQGTVQNLYDILGLIRQSASFTGTAIAGGSTLSCDNAGWWYDQIMGRTDQGTTHALGGSFDSYAGFLQHVAASGDAPVNPEAHSLVEVIAGAEYGLKTAIWWGTAERARAGFVKACQGRRLAYAEDRGRWTAAAVYRSPDGAIQAFIGSSERMGQPTSYRFFSRDRDVFFDGDGPRRDHTVGINGDGEKLVNITWGDDVQPAINGRYVLVNHRSGKVIEVAGAGSGDGARLQQSAYGGGSHQQWTMAPLVADFGDQSYFTLIAVNSGKPADVNNWSYDGGAIVQQWGNATTAKQQANQQWFFEYSGDGYFSIRSRWSGLYLDVSGGSTANGAGIQQSPASGLPNQEWRLIPAGNAVEFTPPAAPREVAATAGAVSVQLRWEPNAEADLASYTVLRREAADGQYEIIARGLTGTTFTDRSANLPRTYRYVLEAVDRSLNRSARSAEVAAAPSGGPALVARYRFDGDPRDSSSNSNHASTNGSPAYVAGKYGSALDLNGTTQYAMLPAGLLAGVTDFTVAAWVWWDGGGAWQRIFDFGNDTRQYLFLTPSSGSGTLRFAITTNGAGAEQVLETSAMPTGQWQHLAVTRQGNTCRLYRNGALAVSGNVTIPPSSFNPAINYLGESQYEADPLFNGRLDELFIYNHALNVSEIARLAANQPPAVEGRQVPADANQDGGLDLADAVWLLFDLFLGGRLQPCSGTETATAADRSLLDANGDAAIDISDAVYVLRYLFAGSAPPVLGTACVPIDGCPDRCAR